MSQSHKKLDNVRNEDAKNSFYALNASMSKPPILPLPDGNKTFFVHTDASKYALKAIFTQKNDKGKLVAVQYANCSLTKSERRYSTFEKEAAAVVIALKKFCHHLLGGPFISYSDHKALQAAFEKVYIYGRLVRWLDIMAKYSFEICYVEDKQNVLAYYLSRSVGEVAVEKDSEERQKIEQYFCKHTKEGLETTELVGMIDGNLDLKKAFRLIKNSLVSGDGTKTHVCLRSQAMKYQVEGRYLVRRSGTELRFMPSIQQRKLKLSACHDTIGHWRISATTDFVPRTFWWPIMRRDVSNFVKFCRTCQICAKEKKISYNHHQPVNRFFDTISMDFAGSLSKTKRKCS